MKIQFLNGGLANQTFQYIFARYYELSHPGQTMYLDDSYFALHTVHNGYELGKVFGLKPHMLSECFDQDVWEYLLAEKKAGKSIPQTLSENGMDTCMITEVSGYGEFNPFWGKVWSTPVNQYHPEIMDYDGAENVYYHGYWIHRDFFAKYEETFRKELMFPEITDEKNKDYLRQIQESQSVSFHIRRGDYLDAGLWYGVEYIAPLVKRFAEGVEGDWHLFVFSDDIEWCRQHGEELGFGGYREITFVEGNMQGKNYIDMQLMSQCKAMIMSNSSFCYLAALLNTQKEYVINPTKWKV